MKEFSNTPEPQAVEQPEPDNTAVPQENPENQGSEQPGSDNSTAPQESPENPATGQPEPDNSAAPQESPENPATGQPEPDNSAAPQESPENPESKQPEPDNSAAPQANPGNPAAPYNPANPQVNGYYANNEYMPAEKKGFPKWLIPVISVAAILFIGIIAAVATIVCRSIFSSNDVSLIPSPDPDNAVMQGQSYATPVPTIPPVPVFTEVSVSSTRNSDVDTQTGEVCYYYANYALDGDYSTCWTPNRSYDSVPFITLSAPTRQHVSGVRFSNGYFKSERTYTKNRRITAVEISYDGGSVRYNCSANQYRIMQDVKFNVPVDTSFIKLTVLSSVDGGWHDIAISEIEVY